MATQTDLQCAFSPERIGTLTATIDGVGPFSYSTGRYWHVNVATTDTTGSGALATALNTSIGASAHSVTCTFNAANLTYTLSGSGNFSATLNQALADAMGLATSLAAASSYTSTKRPKYVTRPLIAGQSMVSDDYNPVGRIKARVAEDGVSQYGVSPYTMPVYNDWTHMYEADAPLANGGTYVAGSGHAVMTRNVTATMPWAWQDMYLHLRAEEFFAWCSQTSPPTAATAYVYKMRGDAATFSPKRAVQDYGLWNLPVGAVLFGRQ